MTRNGQCAARGPDCPIRATRRCNVDYNSVKVSMEMMFGLVAQGPNLPKIVNPLSTLYNHVLK